MAVNLSILFLSIDVVLVIKNPFYPKEWRVRRLYVPIIFSLSIGFAVIMFFLKDPADDR
jgi:hypothetical protein